MLLVRAIEDLSDSLSLSRIFLKQSLQKLAAAVNSLQGIDFLIPDHDPINAIVITMVVEAVHQFVNGNLQIAFLEFCPVMVCRMAGRRRQLATPSPLAAQFSVVMASPT